MPKTVSQQLVWTAVTVLLTVGQPSGRAQESYGDPFEFLAPSVTLSDADRTRLDRGQMIARTLPGKDGQVAVFAATRVNAEPDALVAWTRAIVHLKKSEFVLAIERFSDPPVPSDLDALTLDERDLEQIRECRPGDCGLKLSAPEIESLTAVVTAAGADWRDAARDEFRRLLVERVKQYQAGGLAALPPPADRGRPRRNDAALSAIVKQSPYLANLPNVVAWLQEYPRAGPGVESFFYWSKESYGQGKPVISVTHVGIIRPPSRGHTPAVLVAGKQIFATHYMDGSLGLTMIVRETADGPSYLVYVNRTELDLLKGFFGVFARGILEGRVERQAPQIVGGIRARLESGAPPDARSTASGWLETFADRRGLTD